VGLGHEPDNLLQVKGSAIDSRLRWVREKHGEKALQSLEGLSAAGRNLIRTPLDRRAWYNFPLFTEVCAAIDQRWGTGDMSLNKELGRWGAHRNTPALYHMFIRIGSIDWVLGKSSSFWSEHFNAGRLDIKRGGPKHAEGELIDWPKPHLTHCYSVIGFAIGCIELSGGKNVRAEMVSCRARGAPRCHMRVDWD